MFKLKRLIVGAGAVLLMLPAPGSLLQTSVAAAAGSKLIFYPAADAFVKAMQPNRNTGASAYLRTRGTPIMRSYLRFSVSGLGGLPITRARLLLYSASTSSQGIQAYSVANSSWGEMTITYNNAPAIRNPLATSPSLSSGSWVALDVTSYVKAAGTYTFAVTSNGASGLSFDSREGGANAPRLVVNLGSSSGGSASTIKHIFVILMENHSYAQIWNTPSTPYITQLGNTYARAVNYHAIAHPSLPNYLDIYAGSSYGISTDCSPSSSCHANAPNLADNLEAKGLKWKAYMDSMPTACDVTDSGGYAPRHNPFVYFDDIRTNPTRCMSHVVPFTALAADLAARTTTPNFAFISPNVCNDMHDCSVNTGDNWLQSHVPTILGSPACKVDTCLIMLTWDEDDGGSSNHVLTIFAGSGAKAGAVSSASYTHYSLLRTVERIFGLPTQTSNDAGASPMLDMLR